MTIFSSVIKRLEAESSSIKIKLRKARGQKVGHLINLRWKFSLKNPLEKSLMSKNYYIENQTTKKQGEHIMQKNVTAETPTD